MKKSNAPKVFVNIITVGAEKYISITVNGKESANLSLDLAESLAKSLERQIKLARS